MASSRSWSWALRLEAAVSFDCQAGGDPGNTADPDTGRGAVAVAYEITRAEVSNAQYVELLNAVAAADPNGLDGATMSGTTGGVARSGSDGSLTYATIAGREAWPVKVVSVYDVMRFVDWLHNGQPTGGSFSRDRRADTSERRPHASTPLDRLASHR